MTILLQCLALVAQIVALFQASRLLGFLGRPPGAKFVAVSVWLLAFHTLFVASGNQGQFEADPLLFVAQAFLFVSSTTLAVGSRRLTRHTLIRLLCRIDPNEEHGSADNGPDDFPDFEYDPEAFDGTIVCDGDMQILEADENACELFARSLDEVVGVALPILVTKDEMLRVAEVFSMSRSGDALGVEWSLRRPDELITRVMVKARCLPDDAYRIVMRRLSEKPEEEAREDGFVQVLTTESYVTFDHDLKILAWNKSLASLTGVQADQCLREHLLMHFPIPDALAEHDFITETLEGLSHELRDVHITNTVTGETHLVDQSYDPLLGPSGKIVGGKIIVRPAMSTRFGGAPAAPATEADAPAVEEADGEEISLADFLAGEESPEDSDSPQEGDTIAFPAIQAVDESPAIAAQPEVDPAELEAARLATSALQCSPHIISIFDLTEASDVLYNRSLAAELGYPNSRIEDMGDGYLNEIIHPEDQPVLPRSFADWNDGSGRENRVTEFRVADPQMNWRWYRSADRALAYDDEGNITRIVSIIEDIHEQKEESLQFRSDEGAKVEEITARLTESESRAETLATQLEEAESKLRDSEDHTARRDARIEDLEARLLESDATAVRVPELEEQLQASAARLEEREEQLAEHGARIQQLESKVDETETRLQEAEESLVNRDARIEDLAARLHESEQTAARLDTVEEDLRQRISRIGALEKEVAERDLRIEDLDQLLRNAETCLQESEAQVHTHEVRLGESGSRLQDLTNQVAERESHIANLEAGLREERRQLDERDAQIAKIERILEETRDRLRASETQSTERANRISERDRRLHELENLLNHRNSSIADLASQLGERDSRIGRLKSELSERDSRIAEFSGRLGRNDDRVTELEDRIKQRDTRLTELETQLREREERLLDLKTQLSEGLAQSGELESRLSQIGAELSEKDTTISELRERIGQSADSFDWLEECVWTLDGELRCDFVNRAWRERTGGAEGEDLGDRWRDRLFGQDRDRVLRAVRSAADRREPVSFDCRLSAGAGSFRWTRCHVRPRTSPAGDFLGLIASAADIHEHMLTEQDLRTTLRWHEWAQKSARLGSWEYHPKDDTGFWNDTSLELLRLNGRPSPERLHDFLSQIHPDDRAKLTAAHQQVLKSGQALAQLVFRTHPDLGPVRRLCVAVHRAPEEDGSAYFLVGTLLDVTALQSAAAPVPARAVEPAVAARADDRYRKIVEIAGQGVWMMDAEGYTSFVNPAMIRLLGRKYREFVGRHFFEFLASESTTEAEAFLERRAEGISEQTRFRLLHRAGHHVNALFTTTPLKDDDGEIIGCLCMVTDLTALHEEELSHSETESRSRALLDQAPGCILTVDRKKIIRSASRALPGVPVRQLVGTPLLNWASPADRDGYDEALDRVFDTGNEAALEFRGLGPDEETVRYAARIAPVHQGGEVVSLCVLTQILGDTADAGAADFPRQLLAAQENERRLLAAELHDHFGQSLSATKLNLEALPDDLDPAARQHVDDSLRSVTALIDRTHTLGDRLRPAILDDLGLEPALRWLVSQRADSAGFSASFNADKLPRLAPEIEANAFRIVEAALDNIAQHARPKKVAVELRVRRKEIQVSITDDGKGFAPDKLPASKIPGERLGLAVMSTRAISLGGAFTLDAAPRKGTAVSVTLPLIRPVPARKKKKKSARKRKTAR